MVPEQTMMRTHTTRQKNKDVCAHRRALTSPVTPSICITLICRHGDTLGLVFTGSSTNYVCAYCRVRNRLQWTLFINCLALTSHVNSSKHLQNGCDMINGSQLAEMKSTFLTCDCHNISRVEAVGIKMSNYTIFVRM